MYFNSAYIFKHMMLLLLSYQEAIIYFTYKFTIPLFILSIIFLLLEKLPDYFFHCRMAADKPSQLLCV